MSCNGNNHSDSCTCGWGGAWHGNAPPLGSSTYSRSARIKIDEPRRARLKDDEITFEVHVEALTIPNASCPVCGDPVYFYKNDRGSRVFFDSLGPPWPKHPCTDHSGISRRGGYVEYEGRYYWGRSVNSYDHGWEPYRFVRGRPNGMAVICDMRTEIEYVSNLPSKVFDIIWRLFYLREVDKDITELSSYLLSSDSPYHRTINGLVMKRNRKDKPEWKKYLYWHRVGRVSLSF